MPSRDESRNKAVYHYGEALKIYAVNTQPRRHADLHVCLAETRFEGMRARPTADVCAAIAQHYSTAISIFNATNDTDKLAQAHLSAARACMTVRNASHSLGVGDAVMHLRATLGTFTMKDRPSEWADAQAVMSLSPPRIEIALSRVDTSTPLLSRLWTQGALELPRLWLSSFWTQHFL